MATWGQFAGAAPHLAERGARLLGFGIAYIATSAKGGSPRVHPFTPLIGGGQVICLAGKHTVKYHNLLRDPRYSIHAALGESDEEFLLIGRAEISDDWPTRMQAAIEARKINMTSQNDVAFVFDIERAHWAVWKGLGTPGIHRVAESWHS